MDSGKEILIYIDKLPILVKFAHNSFSPPLAPLTWFTCKFQMYHYAEFWSFYIQDRFRQRSGALMMSMQEATRLWDCTSPHLWSPTQSRYLCWPLPEQWTWVSHLSQVPLAGVFNWESLACSYPLEFPAGAKWGMNSQVWVKLEKPQKWRQLCSRF